VLDDRDFVFAELAFDFLCHGFSPCSLEFGRKKTRISSS